MTLIKDIFSSEILISFFIILIVFIIIDYFFLKKEFFEKMKPFYEIYLKNLILVSFFLFGLYLFAKVDISDFLSKYEVFITIVSVIYIFIYIFCMIKAFSIEKGINYKYLYYICLLTIIGFFLSSFN